MNELYFLVVSVSLVHDFMTPAGASGGSHTATPLSLIFLDLHNIDLDLVLNSHITR